MVLRDLCREVPVAAAVYRQHWFVALRLWIRFPFSDILRRPRRCSSFRFHTLPSRAGPSLLISVSSVLAARLLTASYSITTATDTELLRVIMAAVEGAFSILSHSSYTQLITPNRVSVPISLPFPLPFVFVFSMRGRRLLFRLQHACSTPPSIVLRSNLVGAALI